VLHEAVEMVWFLQYITPCESVCVMCPKAYMTLFPDNAEKRWTKASKLLYQDFWIPVLTHLLL